MQTRKVVELVVVVGYLTFQAVAIQYLHDLFHVAANFLVHLRYVVANFHDYLSHALLAANSFAELQNGATDCNHISYRLTRIVSKRLLVQRPKT